jgi:hypothetical protein
MSQEHRELQIRVRTSFIFFQSEARVRNTSAVVWKAAQRPTSLEWN